MIKQTVKAKTGEFASWGAKIKALIWAIKVIITGKVIMADSQRSQTTRLAVILPKALVVQLYKPPASGKAEPSSAKTMLEGIKNNKITKA